MPKLFFKKYEDALIRYYFLDIWGWVTPPPFPHPYHWNTSLWNYEIFLFNYNVLLRFFKQQKKYVDWWWIYWNSEMYQPIFLYFLNSYLSFTNLYMEFINLWIKGKLYTLISLKKHKLGNSHDNDSWCRGAKHQTKTDISYIICLAVFDKFDVHERFFF